MKDTPSIETPNDSEKQGYRFLLAKTIDGDDDVPALPQPVFSGVEIPTVPFPEGKKYFRIGEVANLIGVEPYVLRYWESEFGSVRPKKSRSGQRIYDRRDVQILATVHHLLHVEKFSLQGAKQKLSEMRKAGQSPGRPPIQRQMLEQLAVEMRSLIALVRRAR